MTDMSIYVLPISSTLHPIHFISNIICRLCMWLFSTSATAVQMCPNGDPCRCSDQVKFNFYNTHIQISLHTHKTHAVDLFSMLEVLYPWGVGLQHPCSIYEGNIKKTSLLDYDVVPHFSHTITPEETCTLNLSYTQIHAQHIRRPS